MIKQSGISNVIYCQNQRTDQTWRKACSSFVDFRLAIRLFQYKRLPSTQGVPRISVNRFTNEYVLLSLSFGDYTGTIKCIKGQQTPVCADFNQIGSVDLQNCFCIYNGGVQLQCTQTYVYPSRVLFSFCSPELTCVSQAIVSTPQKHSQYSTYQQTLFQIPKGQGIQCSVTTQGTTVYITPGAGLGLANNRDDYQDGLDLTWLFGNCKGLISLNGITQEVNIVTSSSYFTVQSQLSGTQLTLTIR